LFALDRIWVHSGERLVKVEVPKSALARVASDHFPLIAHRPPQVESTRARAGFTPNLRE
jgi:hypothetical protein